MRNNLRLVVNNPNNKIEEKQFFEKDELKIILDLYAKMVSGYSPLVPTLGVLSVVGSFLLILIALTIFWGVKKSRENKGYI